MARHIYETGLIGNCAYLAHIHKNTNITWLCWPKFDSSFVFGGMLDDEKGGEFSIKPNGDFTSEQYYLENTNILCTVVDCTSGKYKITDFAPRFEREKRHYRPLMMIRKIEPISGNPQIKIKCSPVYDYGKKKLTAVRSSNHIEYFGCDERIRLTTNAPISYILEDQYFILKETKYVVLTCGEPLEAAVETTSERFLLETRNYWRTWIKRSSIGDFYQDYVIRSALALKIHQFEDTGAFIAASTTSLPEFPGSGRNWDYRYCWLRDTYYVITALNYIGHFEETKSILTISPIFLLKKAYGINHFTVFLDKKT